MVKNLPAVQESQETWVQSPGLEDPFEEGMQPTSAFLPGESPGTEEAKTVEGEGGARGVQEGGHLSTRG